MKFTIKSRQQFAKKLKKRYIFFVIIALMMVAFLIITLNIYNKIYGVNIKLTSDDIELFIPSSPTYEEVISLIEYSDALIDLSSFVWVLERKGAQHNFKGGRYILKAGMNNNTIINLLVGGYQTPVKVVFNNIRTLADLSSALEKRLEPDSVAFITFFTNDSLLEKFGYSQETVLAYILPNTYEMWWTTKPEDFLRRMEKEYKTFWNNNRLEKANQIGLTPFEVAILASIVDEETTKGEERSRVAGLYINRINKKMRLEADPTIKFVLNDFNVRRILNKDLLIDSPYNTYIYAGLPPGPIRMPSTQAIDAVLNYEKHDYIFMCAKEDFSGYHNFAKTLRQHNQNAEKYRRALHNLKIYR